MTAYVSVTAGERKNVLRVPNAALSYKPRRDQEESGPRPPARDRGTQVYLLDDRGDLKPVPVETGLTDNAVTEITSGDLKPGDRVVTRETRPKQDAGGSGGGFRFRMM
jgi:HlyD family secretion protein